MQVRLVVDEWGRYDGKTLQELWPSGGRGRLRISPVPEWKVVRDDRRLWRAFELVTCAQA